MNPLSKYQTTLARNIEFEGVGLHKGKPVQLTMEPAPPRTGLKFVVSDREIPAHVSFASVISRNTELTDGNVSIHTVEHVLSALCGMGVDNATIRMSAPEPPVIDGSSKHFSESIKKTGLEVSDTPAEYFTPAAPVITGGAGTYVVCLPDESFRVTYILDYEHPLVGRRVCHFEGGPEQYLEEIAPARTFGFIEEVDELRKAGLALGGSEENAVVIYPDRLSSELLFEDEFARHKILDMIGDICLLGPVRVRAHFIGIRSGHALNVETVKKILSQQAAK